MKIRVVITCTDLATARLATDALHTWLEATAKEPQSIETPDGPLVLGWSFGSLDIGFGTDDFELQGKIEP
jgi:hypothetical protein